MTPVLVVAAGAPLTCATASSCGAARRCAAWPLAAPRTPSIRSAASRCNSGRSLIQTVGHHCVRAQTTCISARPVSCEKDGGEGGI